VVQEHWHLLWAVFENPDLLTALVYQGNGVLIFRDEPGLVKRDYRWDFVNVGGSAEVKSPIRVYARFYFTQYAYVFELEVSTAEATIQYLFGSTLLGPQLQRFRPEVIDVGSQQA